MVGNRKEKFTEKPSQSNFDFKDNDMRHHATIDDARRCKIICRRRWQGTVNNGMGCQKRASVSAAESAAYHFEVPL